MHTLTRFPRRLLMTHLGAAFIIALALTRMEAAPAPGFASVTSDMFARSLLQRAGMNRGLCAVLGRDGDLPIALAKSSGLLIHVREPDAAAVDSLRAAADQAGFDIQRLAVERGALGKLPYADNTVDIVLCTRADAALLKSLSAAEVLRALRPEGIAIIGGMAGLSNKQLGDWARDAKPERAEVWKDSHGVWVQFHKPALKGAADWSHWECTPDNNPVSDDQLIKAPYLTQFMETPYYIGMPAVTTAAGGRTFLAIGQIAHHDREWETLGRLIARNGYNGAILWERQLPEGYVVHRSGFIATKDTFYLMEGDHCRMLDPKTGAEQGEVRIPGLEGEWKWMSLKDGVLYVLAGKPEQGVEKVKGDRALGGWSWADLSKDYYEKRVPHGYGDVLVAYQLEPKNVLWKHKEESLIDSRGLAIHEDRMFLYCPDKHLRSLSTDSGSIVWTTDDSKTLELIEEAGKGLISTPGWKTETMMVATPKSLVIQGQTRMNVIGVSTSDGKLLWQKKKVTNNPNAIYLDDMVIVGVGPNGSHVALDPVTGEEKEDLQFVKRACTRLTASLDSLFCRGEGMTRFDRESRTVMVDGSARPACNDGVIPANGLLYLGPWSCDCNLSLIGNIARCSAGDFKFDYEVTVDRLEKATGPVSVAPLAVTDRDWPTYRANVQRSASTKVPIRPASTRRWHHQPEREFVPSEATSAGGLIFFGGSDGKVRALNGRDGASTWTFATSGVVKYPPTIAQDRAYFGSADGYAYCVEAATGRLLWRFRAAPVERHIMVYGALSSTWPVHTGVLVHDGVAYFGAGIVDHDGTYLYALDAKTGALKWQNNSTGHLNREQRKGVSVQGNLTVAGNKLVLAGGNVVSPAEFDLKTGQCLEQSRPQGMPQSNGGKFVGAFRDDWVIAGGRILHASPRNVATKGSFIVGPADQPSGTLNFGGIPPAWNDLLLAVVNFKYGRVTTFDSATLSDRVTKGLESPVDRRITFNNTFVNTMTLRGEEKWQSNVGDAKEFETVSIALCPNAVIIVAHYQDFRRSTPQWFMTALAPENGRQLFEQELPGEPLPDGLMIDRDGRVIVTLLDGGAVCYGAPAAVAGR